MFTNKHYVISVWREGSFSKAAEKLYISQPSLSASVKRIEDKISLPLFNRSTTPITLTEAGKEYICYALEIEEKEKEFERYVYDYTNLLTGSVRIGGSSFFSSFMLPKMISEFNKSYPHINFEVFEDSTKNLLEKLTVGHLDIIIDNAIVDNAAISSHIYTTETLLLAVPASYEINELLKDFHLSADDIKNEKHKEYFNCVNLSEFRSYPFILLNHQNDTGSRANLLLKKYSLNPEIVFLLDQQVTAYNTAATGMGITFVSDTLVKNMSSETRLYYYKLHDEEMTRNIYFYRKNSRYLPHACNKFIEFNIHK